MADAYIGEIRAFAGNYAPTGWLICNGSLISIAQNEALFTLMGTTYGGDGINTFGLPNLMGRLVVGMGQGPGLANRIEGGTGGTETVGLATTNLPVHNHTLTVSTVTNPASVNAPSNTTYLGAMNSSVGNALGYLPGNTTGITIKAMNAADIANTGGAEPHDNRMPYLAISYMICTAGIYPSRS